MVKHCHLTKEEKKNKTLLALNRLNQEGFFSNLSHCPLTRISTVDSEPVFLLNLAIPKE